MIMVGFIIRRAWCIANDDAINLADMVEQGFANFGGRVEVAFHDGLLDVDDLCIERAAGFFEAADDA